MHDKLKILSTQEKNWEDKAAYLKSSTPLKTISSLPHMVGITPKTKRFLKLKALFYLIWHDKNKIFLRYFFKSPFSYSINLLRSYFLKKPFSREGDLFFYGLKNEEEFKQELAKEKTHLLVGFSYCHKPFECPSGRFTDACQNDQNSPICGQCFIGKCSLLLKDLKAEIVYIPTIHYIGEKIFEAIKKDPERSVLFLITACEMSLTMFADWGNMVKAKGIGVRLDGRICNTLKAFELSENGIKPGLTVVLDPTKKKMLELLLGL